MNNLQKQFVSKEKFFEDATMKETMPKTIDNRKDILLLLLYSSGKTSEFNEPINGRTRLVKTLFLFCKEGVKLFKKDTEISEENFYEFFPWNFGPYSKQIYDDIMFFELRGFIQSESFDDEVLPESAAEWSEWMRMSTFDTGENLLSEYDEQSFSLTKKGMDFTKELYEGLSIKQVDFLIKFKSKLNSTPLRAILKYVYERYPDFTDKSQIRDKVLSK